MHPAQVHLLALIALLEHTYQWQWPARAQHARQEHTHQEQGHFTASGVVLGVM